MAGVLVSLAAPAGSLLPDRGTDLLRILPPPLVRGSAVEQAELAELLRLQAGRDGADPALRDEPLRLSVFAEVLGPAFTAERLPQTFALGQQVCAEAGTLAARVKRHWQRPRPFSVDARIRPAVSHSSDGSYPSGAALCGHLWAILLAELYPQQREALFATGARIGSDRVRGGVHFPSDIEGGRLAATAVAAWLTASPPFQAALADCRRELGEGPPGN
jgi:acid phosphatase (class A)